MRKFAAALALLTLAGCNRKPDLVDIQKVDPRIRLDIRYATADNFTKQKVYDEAVCYLRPAVAERLSRVQAELDRSGLGLKLWDCYRPHSVQRRFWELLPDDRYVADPAQGSNHNRGAAVDLTLVDAQGKELPMPTEYDDFTDHAHHSYMDAPNNVKENRELLLRAMVNQGFVPMPTEWWHYDDPECRRYPILDLPFAQLR
jgi:D-alanyl-D-alanine dipeptidase